jgi:DNA-binding SARP family transcriptional activator
VVVTNGDDQRSALAGAAPVRPPAVAHAVVRSRVLALLDRRWEHRVTTVVADAGFGKSIALGQAMRANHAQPRGVEGWISCRSGAETPDRLAGSVERAFGAPSGDDARPLSRLQRVFVDLAPVDASLVLDDLEALGPASVLLVDELLRRPPANLHVVLSGRPPLPALALARFRAADELVEVTAEDLRFDDGEVEALATELGVAPLCQDLAGWPALVRLALSSPERAVGDYLWEEVVRTLGAADRQALLALSVLGPSSADEVRAVGGVDLDVALDPDGFCARVPLVHRAGGRLVAHELWAPVRERLGSAGEIEAVTTRAGTVVADRGDPLAWGDFALRLGDIDGLRHASVALVRSTLGSLPVEVAEAWSQRLAAAEGGGGGAGSPEAGLLDAALQHAASAVEPPRAALDRLVEQFLDRADEPGAAVAVALAAVAAEARGDLAHLVSLVGWARGLAERQADPLLELLVAGVEAAAVAMGGDIGSALERLGRTVVAVDPAERPEALARLHWHLLLLAGRAREAAELVAELRPSPGAAVHRELEGVALWLDGDPGALLGGPLDGGPDRYRSLSDRDRFDQASFVAAIAASAGDVEAVGRAVEVLTSSPFSVGASGPDAAVVAVARACRAIVDHEDDRAAALVDDLLDAGPLDPFTDAYLRRSLAVPYVVSARLRDRWDHSDRPSGQGLGPSQQRARRIARGLLDARSGHVPADAPASFDAIATALPLPWSVELAARAVDGGAPWGTALTVRLTDLFGEAATEALARLAGEGAGAAGAGGRDDPARRGAVDAQRAMPRRPPRPIEIRVIGPLEVRREGQPVDAPELRRSRVRQLLGLLVAERSMTRERAVDLLWPDLDLPKGRANLRVTLGHLQRILEPERRSRSTSYFLRVDADQLRLAEVAGLEVDHWQLDRLLTDAAAAARRGDHPERIAALRAAVDLWRGRPLADLDPMAEPSHLGPRLEARIVDAAVTLGELELVAGAAEAATLLAERVRDRDPYDERAHRLAIAAALQTRDRARATAAIRLLEEALAELGADPEPTTQMLLHNTARWLGRPGPGQFRSMQTT